MIDRLAADLAESFPSMKGISTRNLKYMRKFAEAWPEKKIVQQTVAQIPWSHSLRILDSLSETTDRFFYIRETARNGWTRSELSRQIKCRLHQRQGQAPNSFEAALPAGQSDLAKEVLKDPYIFDFFSLPHDSHERDVEKALLDHLRKFLLELGVGFAFVGSQVPLHVEDDLFYLDLLFYHTRLRC